MATLEITLFIIIFIWLADLSTKIRNLPSGIDIDMLAEEVKDQLQADSRGAYSPYSEDDDSDLDFDLSLGLEDDTEKSAVYDENKKKGLLQNDK